MTLEHTAGRSTDAQRSLADFCEWLPAGARRPCYVPATLVLVRPAAGGDTLRFSCAEHREAWAARIHGKYVVLEWDEWVARGRGYRGLSWVDKQGGECAKS